MENFYHQGLFFFLFSGWDLISPRMKVSCMLLKPLECSVTSQGVSPEPTSGRQWHETGFNIIQCIEGA